MGVVGPFRSSSACGCAAPMQPTARPTGSPDPDRFDIVTVEPLGPWLICTVNYPDCTNHEGRKLLLFYGVTEEGLRRQETLDPHFCDNPEHLSPVARFEPTRRGLALARELAGRGITVNCVAPGVIRTRFHKDMPEEKKQHNLKHRIPLH
ncbi:hypothetical protein LCGC14_0823420, partial [marine sediment metagenome]